jgi:hypothetical protein
MARVGTTEKPIPIAPSKSSTTLTRQIYNSFFFATIPRRLVKKAETVGRISKRRTSWKMASNETSELAYRVKCKTKTSRGISPGCRENHTLLIDQLYLMEAYCIRRSKALFPRELAKNVKRRVVTVREVNMNLESSKNLNIRVDCVCSGNGCRLFPSRGGELRTGVLGIESVITRASKTMSPKPMNIGSQTLRSIKNEAIGITVN